MTKCPCCGSILSVRDEVRWNESGWTIETAAGVVTLSHPQQAKLFNLLWHHRASQILTRRRIIEVLYADDANGGPDPQAISNAIIRLRKVIAPIGLAVTGGTTAGGGYRLESCDPTVALGKVGSDRATYMQNYRAKIRLTHMEPNKTAADDQISLPDPCLSG